MIVLTAIPEATVLLVMTQIIENFLLFSRDAYLTSVISILALKYAQAAQLAVQYASLYLNAPLASKAVF